MTKDGRTFKIVQEQQEFCLLLKEEIKLCGRQHVDDITRVKNGQRSPLAGYIMEFNFAEFDDLYDDNYPDDIYSDYSGSEHDQT